MLPKLHILQRQRHKCCETDDATIDVDGNVTVDEVCSESSEELSEAESP